MQATTSASGGDPIDPLPGLCHWTPRGTSIPDPLGYSALMKLPDAATSSDTVGPPEHTTGNHTRS